MAEVGATAAVTPRAWNGVAVGVGVGVGVFVAFGVAVGDPVGLGSTLASGDIKGVGEGAGVWRAFWLPIKKAPAPITRRRIIKRGSRSLFIPESS